MRRPHHSQPGQEGAKGGEPDGVIFRVHARSSASVQLVHRCEDLALLNVFSDQGLDAAGLDKARIDLQILIFHCGD